MNNLKVFVTGGAKSGKSAWAMKAAKSMPDSINGEEYFIATAEALDEEMKEKIEKHKKERPKEWKTIEEPIDILTVLKKLDDTSNVLLVDCLGIWASNVLLKNGEGHLTQLLAELVEVIDGFKGSLIFVSNEVGMGIVPANKDTRLYRDMLGAINQAVAAKCDVAVLIVSGIPLFLKGGFDMGGGVR